MIQCLTEQTEKKEILHACVISQYLVLLVIKQNRLGVGLHEDEFLAYIAVDDPTTTKVVILNLLFVFGHEHLLFTYVIWMTTFSFIKLYTQYSGNLRIDNIKLIDVISKDIPILASQIDHVI
jgi:hypothetical protein